MPRGDMTGPPRGAGGGRGGGRRGLGGRGRMGGNLPGSGPGGNCVCPNCGTTVPHQAGTPCYSINCPKCGTKMMRA